LRRFLRKRFAFVAGNDDTECDAPLTLPWRGRVGTHERSECEPGWGEGLSPLNTARVERSPHPAASRRPRDELRSSRPLQGRVRNRARSQLKHTFAFSRRDAPEVLQEPSLPPNRGRRESRVSDAPAAARGVVVSTRVSHHEFTGNIRLSPRNGFNGLFRALPGDRALLPPSLTDNSANLTPASGCQDHTTSPSARVSFARTLACADTVASTASRTQRP
jgi:hypothetical protein